MDKRSCKTTSKKHSASSGFSMLELVVAAGVLGFTLVALLAFFLNAIYLNELSRDRTTAISHAQYVTEDIRNTDFSTVPAQITAGTWNWNTATVSAKGLVALKDESITTSYSGSGIITVTVTVSWNEAAGRAQSMTLTTEMGGG